MKKIKHFILLALCLSCYTYSGAQTDTLRLYNIVVNNEFRPVTTMPNSAPAALPDSMPFRLVFKISDVPKLAKIYIQVGTTVDNGSILTRELSKIQRGDEVFLQGAGENFKIWNTSGYYLFKLPKNLTGIKWLTIYAKDAQGKLTKKEHFKF